MASALEKLLLKKLKVIPNFPKKGIQYKLRPVPLLSEKVKFELPGIVCVIFVQVLFPDAVNENAYA